MRKAYKPATKHYRHNWSKCWPELNRSPDHQEQLKPSRLWKRQLPFSDKTSPHQNLSYQNMPPETDAGNALQLSNQYRSRICSSTTSRRNTARTKSWETKSHKWSDRIPNWHSKFRALMKLHQRNS